MTQARKALEMVDVYRSDILEVLGELRNAMDVYTSGRPPMKAEPS